MIAYIALFSALLSRLIALVCGSAWVTSFYSAFFEYPLTALAWLVPHETAAVSAQVLCTPYNHAPCHFMQSHIRISLMVSVDVKHHVCLLASSVPASISPDTTWRKKHLTNQPSHSWSLSGSAGDGIRLCWWRYQALLVTVAKVSRCGLAVRR